MITDADRLWMRRLKIGVAIFLTIASGAALAITSCAAAFNQTFSMTRSIPVPPLYRVGMVVGAVMFVCGVIWLVVVTIIGIVRMFRNRWEGFH
jgi:hypothetical protein